MLKRILVLLGETSSSISARQYAFRLAARTDAGLAGLAGIDLADIEAPLPGGIGASAYKNRLEGELRNEAESIQRRLHETFELECRNHNVPFEWLSFEGDPIESLYLAAETRDLMITGHDTTFCGKVYEQYAGVIAKLLSITPRPVIVCPDQLSANDAILIAYDGSVPAMRAIQSFALLGVGRGERVCVTSIDASQELAARRAAGAASYLRTHGYEVDANPIASRVHPSDVLPIEIADRRIGTLVMGAYGHRGFREVLFGSTTSALVERPPCALFVYT
jgi:nucleotide-binding universal stress UspA family protein